FGYTESFQEYAQWLWEADFLPVTSNQDFFGASIMEAVYCNSVPLLPERLTYPELFNKKDNPHLFYENETDLINKLEEMLIKNSTNMKNNLPKIAYQYDWDFQAKSYDKTLSELV
ncbi:MAG: DUF3524 domain-containing protein, partial [Candidatus Marinimicrobia bacterium]|nr:DUF3524 domain-containing protein [Candidatus Neomarinimicrobiota bacterium]